MSAHRRPTGALPLRCGHTLHLDPPAEDKDDYPFYCLECGRESFRADHGPPHWVAWCSDCDWRKIIIGGKERAQAAVAIHAYQSRHTPYADYRSVP